MADPVYVKLNTTSGTVGSIFFFSFQIWSHDICVTKLPFYRLHKYTHFSEVEPDMFTAVSAHFSTSDGSRDVSTPRRWMETVRQSWTVHKCTQAADLAVRWKVSSSIHKRTPRNPAIYIKFSDAKHAVYISRHLWVAARLPQPIQNKRFDAAHHAHYCFCPLIYWKFLLFIFVCTYLFVGRVAQLV